MLIRRILDQVGREPLAAFAISIALVVPFVTQYIPSYSDRLAKRKSEAEEYVLLCTQPKSDSVVLHENNGSEGKYSLLYPVTCTLSNNTSESVSISEYGPRLIDGRVSYRMIGEPNPFPAITLAPEISNIVAEEFPLPRLLSPKEQFMFKSVIAIPIDNLLDDRDKVCKTPSADLLKNRSITICSTGRTSHLLGNYTNLYFSTGFIGWNKYGAGVSFGNGKEVVYQTDREFTPLHCEQEGGENSSLCRKAGTYYLPKPYWTNSRGLH